MFEKFKSLLEGNLFQVLGVPTALSGVTFVSNVVQSLSDGNLSHSELQGLISSASGIETLILLLLMIALKFKK